jgi:hypothetical protein
MVAPSLIAKLILTAFLFAALFGIYGMISFSQSGHGSCPFSPDQHPLCVTPLEHLDHWQAVFTAVFVETIVLFALVALFFTHTALTADTLRSTPWSYREKVPLRPTLLQELFSQGILHRKEPQIA